MSDNGPRPIGESLQEYGRGIAGGLLFSLPLLYTMEIWWQGFIASPLTLLLYLGFTFVLLLGYNRYSGMRSDAHFYEVIVDSLEEMGLGLLISTGILYLLGRITWEMPFHEVLGKIVIEAMTVAIGVSVGTAQLGGTPGNSDTGMKADGRTGGKSKANSKKAKKTAESHEKQQPDAWGQLVLGFCGAVLIASNVAPTEEIVMIGVETSAAHLLGLALLSVGICALILFYSGFTASERHVRSDAPFWISYGVVTSYAVALLASALMLWFFGRFNGESLPVIISQTVVLAFPAALGASAGRLLIQ